MQTMPLRLVAEPTSALQLARLSPQREQVRVQIVCLPPTAGGFFSFLPWLKTPSSLQPLVPADVALWGVQLDWTAPWRFAGLVSTVTDALEAQRTDAPLVLCGASLGALLAFGVARELRRRQAKAPLGLVVIAMCAPRHYQPPAGWDAWQLSDWRSHLQREGDTPAEVLHAPARLEQLVAQLRGGLSIAQDFTYTSEAPFAFPFATFAGEHDQLYPPVTLAGWQEQTTNACAAFCYPEAGHLALLQVPAMRTSMLVDMVETVEHWMEVAE